MNGRVCPSGRRKTLNPRSRIWRGVLLFVLSVYAAPYAFISSQGHYVGHNEGGRDNRETWFPAYCGETYRAPSGRQRARLTPVGWFYLPLIALDQSVVHPTHFE